MLCAAPKGMVKTLAPCSARACLQGATRFAGSASGTQEARLVERRRQAQVEATVQRERLRVQASRTVGPFRETRDSTQGAADIMSLLLRPTSPSLAWLAFGLTVSTVFVVGMHWLLHPMDPLCVLSIGTGAFVYVFFVGSSHSLGWYLGAAPLVMLALLVAPGWQTYLSSLEGTSVSQVRRRRDVSPF